MWSHPTPEDHAFHKLKYSLFEDTFITVTAFKANGFETIFKESLYIVQCKTKGLMALTVTRVP